MTRDSTGFGSDAPSTSGGQAPVRAVGAPIAARPDDTSQVKVSTDNYSTETCLKNDIDNYIRPGDDLARRMLLNAISILGEDPPRKEIPDYLRDFFGSRTPDVPRIVGTYKRLMDAFVKGGYVWKCADCEKGFRGKTKYAPIIGHYGPMTLCMAELKKYPIEGFAKTMIHEMGHRALDLDDVDLGGGLLAYCAADPSDPDGCPSILTEEEALKNADSFACFATKIWKLRPPGP